MRGKTVPLDKLAPILIKRAKKRDYIAIIIDPIYKIITGDENSADQMAKFCNNFDKVCTELGCSVIYCHHHSKGAQGAKRSMDRASGSGVFARDPDALLDFIELDVTENLVKEQKDEARCKFCAETLKKIGYDDYSQDDAVTAAAMIKHCQNALSKADYEVFFEQLKNVEQRIEQRTAWRIEGTLREFPKFPSLNVWFDFPVHRSDNTDVLKDLNADGEYPAYQIMNEKRKKQAAKQNDDNKERFESAVKNACCGEAPSVEEVANYLGMSDRTIRRYVTKYGYFVDKNNNRIMKNDNDKK